MCSKRIRSFSTSYHRNSGRRRRLRVAISSSDISTENSDDSTSTSRHSNVIEQHLPPNTVLPIENHLFSNVDLINTIFKLFTSMSVRFKINDVASKSLYTLIKYINDNSIKLPDYKQFKETIFSKCSISFTLLKYNCSLRDFTDMETQQCCSQDHGAMSVFEMEASIYYIIQNNSEYLLNKDVRTSDNFGDFIESTCYKQIWSDLVPLSCQDHVRITLLVNLDDASMVKSNATVVTPLTFTIAELPHHRRYVKSNVMTAGIWWGSQRLRHDLLWENCIKKPLSDLFNGKILRIGGREVLVCVRIGLVIMDSVAKPKSLNCMLFNAEYGCPYCKQRCESTTDHRNRNHRIYQYDLDDNPTLKSHEFYIEAASIASDQERPHYGINGSTILTSFIKVPNQVPVDYMHACLEGIFRALLLKLIHREPNLTNTFDEHVKNIAIPHEFTRKVRPLSLLTHWKAHELRMTAFYLLPIFRGKISDDSFKLLSCFVIVLRIMVQKELSRQDINDLQFLIGIFLKSYQDIFGVYSMTFNLHLLRHLPHQISEIGNCTNYSSFVYENNMYNLKQGFHGTRGQLNQISKTYCLSKAVVGFSNESVANLPDELRKFLPVKSHEVKRFIDKPVASIIHDGQVFRTLKRFAPWATRDNAKIFPRMKLDKVIFHSLIYTYKRASASYYFSHSISLNQKPNFGLIEYFIGLPSSSRTTTLSLAFVVFRKFKTFESQSVHTGSDGCMNRNLRAISNNQLLKKFFYKLRLCNDIGVIKAERIKNKAIIFKERNEDDIYWGSELVENFEHD